MQHPSNNVSVCILGAAFVSHQDKRVGLPVGRSDLVRQPGGDCFGGRHAEFRHGLRNVFDSIQQPLARVVVVLQKAVRLKGEEPAC